tara:strand:- start:1101 stop:1880 length:780 start_codon:yes stop_codon:yes gene_type:complete
MEKVTKKSVRKAELFFDPKLNSNGEASGDGLGLHTASLRGLEKDTLTKALNGAKINNVVMREVTYKWHNPDHKMKLDILASKGAEWIADPTPESQAEAVKEVKLIPNNYRNAAKIMDLEHRKITPDADGNVAELVDLLDKNKNQVIDPKTGQPKQVWNKAGKTLFSSKEREAFFNLAHRCIELMPELEGQHGELREDFIAEGGRTVTTKVTKGSMVQTLVKPRKGAAPAKSFDIQGTEYSSAELERLAAEGLIQINQQN